MVDGGNGGGTLSRQLSTCSGGGIRSNRDVRSPPKEKTKRHSFKDRPPLVRLHRRHGDGSSAWQVRLARAWVSVGSAIAAGRHWLLLASLRVMTTGVGLSVSAGLPPGVCTACPFLRLLRFSSDKEPTDRYYPRSPPSCPDHFESTGSSLGVFGFSCIICFPSRRPPTFFLTTPPTARDSTTALLQGPRYEYPLSP